MKSQFAAGTPAVLLLPVFGVATADAPSTEQTVMQMERDSTQALIAGAFLSAVALVAIVVRREPQCPATGSID